MQGSGISIDCFLKEDRPPSIRIDRPVHAARMFTGKSPDTVTELIPLVFAVCGFAQGAAASNALARAAGIGPEPGKAAAQGVLVRLETAREHLWRALMDWPRFVNAEPRSDVPAGTMPQMQALLPRAREALFSGSAFALEPDVAIDRTAVDELMSYLDQILEHSLLGCPVSTWLELGTLEDLERLSARPSALVPLLLGRIAEEGWESACAVESSFLPALAFDELETELAGARADRFVELPDWQGLVRETSPLSRQCEAGLVAAAIREYGPGVLARVIAAVSELAMTSRDIAALLDGSIEPGIHASTVSPDTGIAQVEAARGRLLHRAVVRNDRVESYRVVAPTEWNFHPAGVVSTALGRLPRGNAVTARNQADLFVTLMDPCVSYSVEVH